MSRARCRIAILGFGTVGSAVARRLTGPLAPAGLDLTHIFDRNAARKREALVKESGASSVTWTTDIGEILAADLERLQPGDAVPADFIDLAEANEFAPEIMDGECSA